MEQNKLLKLSSPKYFAKGEYICSEGESGDEMYIILQGEAGVYISSVAEEDILAATIKAGEFFGEMALFDKKPRSATCIAHMDTVCIAINREQLHDFIVTCPDITEKLIRGLSGRVRLMDEKLYKMHPKGQVNPKLPFIIPANHKDSTYEDKSSAAYIKPMKVKCPVCGSLITARSVQVMPRTKYEILLNQRKKYDDLEPLWYFIRSCPECGYTNDSIHFQQLPEVPVQMIKEVLTEEKRADVMKLVSPFGRLAGEYYRAIHFNQCLNGEDTLLLGKLWLYLGWIYEDAGQKDMSLSCHEKALEYYCLTSTKNHYLLYNEFAEKQCLMVIAELYYERGDYNKAKEYYHEVAGCSNKRLAEQALDRIYELRDLEGTKKRQE